MFFRRILFWCSALSVLASLSVHAQNFANNLAVGSTDPVSDSIAISTMRARMDSIRNAEHRPTVALVLSGGGAKGAAYVIFALFQAGFERKMR